MDGIVCVDYWGCDVCGLCCGRYGLYRFVVCVVSGFYKWSGACRLPRVCRLWSLWIDWPLWHVDYVAVWTL